MTKFLGKVFLAAIICFIGATYSSNAQLDAGAFGIGASFGNYYPISERVFEDEGMLSPINPLATGFFAISEKLDVSLGIGYNSVTSAHKEDDTETSTDPATTMMLQAMGRFFLTKGRDVSPYVGGILSFTSFPGWDKQGSKYSRSSIGLSVAFGAQAYVAKNFAIYGQVALGYHSESSTSEITDGPEITDSYSTISLTGSSIGAVFYFGN